MADVSMLGDTPILAAEFHYFRSPPELWALSLIRLRQMGVNTVSTYVPWCWHEPRPGELDFTGVTNPRRDLVRFIILCQALGLRLILKPGPFIDAETLGGGIPPWLLHTAPEIHARRADDTIWRHSDSDAPRACYLHPTYLAAARRWIAAFSQVALPFQFPAGPVIALQADNETPGDGLLPADAGLDPRLRLDYNAFVVEHLWPAFWANGRTGNEETGRTGDGAISTFNLQPSTFNLHPPPRALEPPRSLADLRQYLALELFTDWFYAESVAVIARWLREDGWHAPIFHDLLAAPWQRCGSIVDVPALARATGWLGFNVYAEDVVEPFVGGAGYVLSFEEYVHYGFWRPRLMASLSPGYPVLVPEISAAQDFYFATPLMGGAQAINVYVAQQASPDSPLVGAYPRWAMEAPLRPDGGVRRRFWNAKTLFMLLNAAGADFAAAHAPAGVAIGYSHIPERAAQHPGAVTRELSASGDMNRRAQQLAQRLAAANIAFHVVDLDAATPESLAAIPLLLVPATAVLARETQQKLAACPQLTLVGDVLPAFDEDLEPCDIVVSDHVHGALVPRLPESIGVERLVTLIEQHGGHARYGWADRSDVDVAVRHGARYTYVMIANRRRELYNGTITYRVVDESLQHLHVGIGGPRIGVVLVSGDDVAGCAIGGDASEGPWLVRGMHSSIMFNGGAGAVAPCGDGLRFSAAQSGRFQARRRIGWEGLSAWRLLLNGDLLPASLKVEGNNLALPYVAEDERGITDSYLLLSSGPLPPSLHADLRTLLLARALLLRDAIAPLTPHDPACLLALEALPGSAAMLEELANRPFAPDEYATVAHTAMAMCEPAVAAAARDLARARGDYLAGALAEAEYQMIEHRLGGLLEAIARASLRVDEE